MVYTKLWTKDCLLATPKIFLVIMNNFLTKYPPLWFNFKLMLLSHLILVFAKNYFNFRRETFIGAVAKIGMNAMKSETRPPLQLQKIRKTGRIASTFSVAYIIDTVLAYAMEIELVFYLIKRYQL